MKKYFFLLVLLSFSFMINAQVNNIEGYVYEDGNRGFLNQVAIEIIDKSTGVSVYTGETNKEGYFEAKVPATGNYVVNATKQLFFKKSEEFKGSGVDGEKQFVKVKMQREPGYDFEVTLAPKRDSPDIQVDAITGAWVEVYNNTTKKEVLNFKDHPEPDFDVHFDQGNHYTIMIRKDGFLTKRMEAYVNVEGCILCFDGVGNVQPGVTDNLSDKNTMGVLLANVELDPLFDGKTFTVENIFYDLGKATLRAEAKKSLQSLALVIKDNPQIKVELGAHTDSRGTSESNLDLSKRRAKAAVEYLVNDLDVSNNQIISAGFGEKFLKNKCADGVDCSEKEHQENRRTEIRVLNIDQTKKNLKSLAEIRVEEEFLKSLFDGDDSSKTVNEIPDDSSLGGQARSQAEIEQIEKEIREQEARKAQEMKEREEQKKKDQLLKQKEDNEKMQIAQAEEKKRQEMIAAEQAKVKMQQQKEAEIRKMDADKAKMEMEAKRIAAEKEQREMEAAKSAADKAKMEAEQKAAEQFKMEAEKMEMEEAPAFEGESNSIEKKANIQSELADKQFGNRASQEATYIEMKKRRDPMFKYNGYRIVVHFSQDPISNDHEIFKRHDDLIDYKSSNGTHLYLIGDFKTEEDADEFLLGRVKQVYPGAYIVGFRNGNRLN